MTLGAQDTSSLAVEGGWGGYPPWGYSRGGTRSPLFIGEAATPRASSEHQLVRLRLRSTAYGSEGRRHN